VTAAFDTLTWSLQAGELTAATLPMTANFMYGTDEES